MTLPSEAIAICSACNTENDLIAAGIDRLEAVSCSHCRSPLGLWGDLVDTANSGIRSLRYEPGGRPKLKN